MRPPVLLVAGEYPPDRGGLADYTARLQAALDARGVQVTVSGPRGRWDAAALRGVARTAPPGAVVHLQYQPAAFGLRGEICLLPLALRALRPDTRAVTTFHDARVPYVFRGAGPLRGALVRLLARTSHAAVAADPSDLAWLRVPPGRGHPIPIGANVDPSATPPAVQALRDSLGLGAGALVVAYFGFLNASKGLGTLAAAFARVANRRPDARLLLLGGRTGASDPTDRGTAAAFEALVGPLGPRVLQPGYLEAERLSAHLLLADVALLPFADGASARRGSLLACAAHGLPIVSTQGPGAASPLLRDRLLLAPPGDAEALAGAVLRVAAEPALRARLVEGSRALAEEVRWDRIAERHAALYAQVRD